MKAVKKVLCMIFTLALLCLSVSAEQKASLTVSYEPIVCEFELYKICDFTEEDGFSAAPPFDSHSQIKPFVDRIESYSADELRVLSTTLESVVKTEGVSPVRSLSTDEKGILVFDDIEPGLYLVLGEKSSDGQYVYTPSPVLVSVPSFEGTSYVYDVTLEHVKYDKEPVGEKEDIKVIKTWKDTGYKDLRPNNVKAQLYCDGELYDTVSLNEDNGWTYVWKDLPTDRDWQVKELNPERYYYVSITKYRYYMIINNEYTYDDGGERVPGTGQLWWPVPVLAAAGITVLAVGFVQKKRRDDQP